MSKSVRRGETVGGRELSMHEARRGHSLWDIWNQPDSSDELQVAMDLLAIVRRDKAFSREVVRAFGITRSRGSRPPLRNKQVRRGPSPRRTRGN